MEINSNETQQLIKEIHKSTHPSSFSNHVSIGDMIGPIVSLITVIFLFGKLNQTVKRLEDDMRRNFDHDKIDGDKQDDRLIKLEVEVAKLNQKISCLKDHKCKDN